MQRKETMHCEHCGMTGHTMSTCFKIHGYPEWYKELKQNRNSAKARANMVIDELNSSFESEDILRPKNEVG